MIDWSWIGTTGSAAVMVVISALGIYAALILFTRLVGLRSFSKMSSFDFAVTVAFGSMIASTVLAKDPPLLQAVVGLASLYLIQYVVARVRGHSTIVSRLVDNQPVLVMAGSEVLHENLKKVQMTEEDLRAKLREANVINREQVRAVVMESTGDVTVVHDGADADMELDLDLFKGVEASEKLRSAPRTS